MNADVGADIESLCRKCGDVWHVVVAKVGTQIAKVQCKECGAYHRYRPVDGSSASGQHAATVRRRSSGGSGGQPVARIERAAVEPDLSRPVRRYNAREQYQVADRVEHPTFGFGVVEEVRDGKIQVFFGSGRKLLALVRSASKLERPKPVAWSDRNEKI